ncbi:high-affinity glucose transporter 1 [[Candida] jaroonii]|uniref:High-affinity glucose transporter 1 n=1 Tax=[Candida] jaroonii TaxID=467808 RepID=A0ACA9Y9L9_9ASCO|nr:high-affinity glucose transporter 1 [[Candida] jaroonii]
MAIYPKLNQFLICCFVSIGSFAYGYDLSVIAQVIASESFLERLNPTINETSAVVSLFTGGAFFGAFAAGYLSDYLGRKYTITTSCAVFILGGILQATCVNIGMLVAGRFIAGLAVGSLCMIIPLFQAELAHPSIRGTVTSLQQFFLGIGALVASWIAYGSYVGLAGSEKQFRLPLGLQVVPIGLLFFASILLPESPRWLAAHGKRDQALITLAKLHSYGNVNDSETRAQYHEIIEEVEFEKANPTVSWIGLFATKDRARRTSLSCILQASVQMTGVSSIQYYSVTIFRKMGLTTGRTLLYQSINSIIALIAQALCFLTIDFTGRRWVLISTNLLSSVCFIVATILMAKFPAATTSSRPAQIGFIASTWIYNFVFSYGIGPLSWVIPSESFNLQMRSKGISLATMVSFAFNTMIGQVTAVAMERVGYRFYYLFCICCFTNALFFWAFLPETRRVPLELSDEYWKEAPLFVPGWKPAKDYSADLKEKANILEAGRRFDVDSIDELKEEVEHNE